MKTMLMTAIVIMSERGKKLKVLTDARLFASSFRQRSRGWKWICLVFSLLENFQFGNAFTSEISLILRPSLPSMLEAKTVFKRDHHARFLETPFITRCCFNIPRSSHSCHTLRAEGPKIGVNETRKPTRNFWIF